MTRAGWIGAALVLAACAAFALSVAASCPVAALPFGLLAAWCGILLACCSAYAVARVVVS